MTLPQPASHRETLRGFWHGPPIGPYQLLCLRSFVDHGHNVEVFTYDDPPGLPEWVVRRNASDILPTDRVLHYQQGFGKGSPALHANLFRYSLLHRLGGWWIDLDLLLLRPELPRGKFFLGQAANGYATLHNSMMKLPASHPLLADAVRQCCAVPEDAAVWGQTGPLLLTQLVSRHGLADQVRPWQTSYPVPWQDIIALFDPKRCAEVEEMCRDAIVLHMFNEIWRGAGIPADLGPPPGSFLSACFRRHDFGHRFHDVMSFDAVDRWVANRREQIRLEESRLALQRQRCEAEDRCRQLAQRVHELEKVRIELARACQQAEDDRQALERRLQQLDTAHRAVLASTSWRMTQPLRSLMRTAAELRDRTKPRSGRRR